MFNNNLIKLIFSTGLLFFFVGSINAAGWHTADEILSGNFSGFYDFDNTPTIEGVDIQLRVSSSCPVGESIRVINVDGSVTCEVDSDTLTNYTDLNTSYVNTGEVNSITSAMIVDGTITDLDVDSLLIQLRVNSSCSAGNSIRVINSDGTVTCEADTDVDTNAGTLCAAGQFLNGDGTCDSVISDTDTHAGTICSAGQFLNGDGTCDSVVVDTNTNAGTICSAGQFLNGDGTCDSVVVDTYNSAYDTETEIDVAVANNGYFTTSNDGSGSGLDADLLDGYDSSRMLIQKTDIPTAANLDTYTTTGLYHQNMNANAAAGTNYPESLAGMLKVIEDGNMVYQEYTVYNSPNNVWVRVSYIGTWTSWSKIWSAQNDGSGSGLDADTLDGISSAGFLAYSLANGYDGLNGPNSGTSNWIRTTTNGIIPYQSGGASALGTSSWPFNSLYLTNAYISTMYDRNDNNYYVNPASTSRFNVIRGVSLCDESGANCNDLSAGLGGTSNGDAGHCSVNGDCNSGNYILTQDTGCGSTSYLCRAQHCVRDLNNQGCP